MVIQIRLGDRVEHTPQQIADDSLNRPWSGYDAHCDEATLWEHNRGRWTLDEKRIADETIATFVHGGRVVGAYEIDGYERVADPGPRVTKIALIGRPLSESDPLRKLLIGQTANHSGRNAINYVADPTDDRRDRRAFLLTWNPDNWEWTDFGERVADIESGRTVVESWSTGNRTSGICAGDRVYLLRQGNQGRGLVGSGEAVKREDAAVSDELVYQDEHWDGSGDLANYVDVAWDCLLHTDDRLVTETLQLELADQNWTPYASGNEIRPNVAALLEGVWSAHIARAVYEGGGQGYLADARRRKAIEDAAQDWLMQEYRDDGWDVRDTRYSGPYDAIASRGDETLFLEAKGTQGNGDTVFLTRGEVDHARRHKGNCMIGIWSQMRFDQSGQIDQFAGETLVMPFDPDFGTLSPLQYRWELPTHE